MQTPASVPAIKHCSSRWSSSSGFPVLHKESYLWIMFITPKLNIILKSHIYTFFSFWNYKFSKFLLFGVFDIVLVMNDSSDSSAVWNMELERDLLWEEDVI